MSMTDREALGTIRHLAFRVGEDSPGDIEMLKLAIAMIYAIAGHESRETESKRQLSNSQLQQLVGEWPPDSVDAIRHRKMREILPGPPGVVTEVMRGEAIDEVQKSHP